MKPRSYLVAVMALTFWIGSLSIAGTLSEQQRAKIHPQFRALLAETRPDLGFAAGSTQQFAATIASDGVRRYGAIIHVTDPDLLRAAGIQVNAVFEGFVTARLTPDDILMLAQLDGVSYLDPGSINYPTNDISVPATGASLLHGGFLQGTPYNGSGAIVLVFDTGIDWKHGDFRSPTDPTKSRILAIWDITLSPQGAETSPAGFPGIGVEYTQAQINAELGPSPPGFVREQDINGHGTHVTGTAAGNGQALGGRFTGMAPGADIIAVKGGNGSFSSVDIINSLTYASSKASQLGKPVVVNWSLGGQSGPHDGTSDYEVAADQFTSTPGHVVVIAAGNDGANPIHVSGSAGTANIVLTVPAYTPNPGTGNDQFVFDLWFKGNPTITATATSPHGVTATATNATGQGNGSTTTDGSITVYNEASYTSNGDRLVQLYVSDLAGTAPAAGTWTLSITNSGAAVAYDGWLWSHTVGAASVALNGADVNKTVASPGTSRGAITAGAYETRWTWPSTNGSQYNYSESNRTDNICSFSGIGPTRDGRLKPDLAAPGQGIASSLSSAITVGASGLDPVWVLPGQKHFISQGTSQATPHVTGATALILGGFPGSTAAEIKSLLSSTANADAFASALPNVTWGNGKMDVLEALAKKISPTAVVTRAVVSSDGTGSSSFLTLTGTKRFAVRYSPAASGSLTGMTVTIETQPNRPVRGNGNLVCDVYSDNGGVPGSKLGSTVSVPLGQLTASGLANYVQMLGAGVSITSGTDFHLVISVGTPTDTLLVRTESVSNGTHSSTFNGATWSAVTQNHRMRAIVTTTNGPVSVHPGAGETPVTYALEQNYPNPFNPTTEISYSIGEPGGVTLRVFDILGREVATLVNGREGAGSYRVTWNGRNAQNLPVTSGVYFYRLESGSYVKTNRMILLK